MNRNVASAMFAFFMSLCVALGADAKVCRACSDTVRAEAEADSVARLMKNGVVLREVVVDADRSGKEAQMRSALNTVSVAQDYIKENFGGSLMQTLSRLPGVKSMSVGSGESKPIIRRMGFNRVVVAENGIKHVGQEWGDDHGLEVDQHGFDRVEVLKGPASLVYGSDAIGGAINLRSDVVPQSFGGSADVFARSNNGLLGTALRMEGRSGQFWWKANATATDYADYRVPADSIQYYSYYIKLHDQRLRNTAGRELDGSATIGYDGARLKGWLRFSDVNTRSGYFANAHGLEVLMSGIDYDSSARDIDLPFHSVNHLMLTAHGSWQWSGGQVEATLAWQHNRQREKSEPISHGYMPVPPDDLERSFGKSTATASIGFRQAIGRHTIHAGASFERQANRRGGWGFILPDFEQTVFGAYAYDRFSPCEGLVFSAGARYDHGSVAIHSYRDWYKTPTAGGDSAYIERSADMSRAFNSVTWSAGVDWHTGDFVLKANVGKSFRMPIAKELGMDGINYNIFRYEKGNASLDPEESYQIDAGAYFEHGPLSVSATPYVNFFPNYIYLNPTADYREGLQLYYYTQSRVLRWGFEASASIKLLPVLTFTAEGEYVHARQLSGIKKGYTLPFSTPWSARGELRYDFPVRQRSHGGFAAIEVQAVGTQNDVVPPEEPTKGHCLLNAAVGKTVGLLGNNLRLTLRCDNIAGTRYYDHTSYYRLIGVPEPGRNFSLMASYEF